MTMNRENQWTEQQDQLLAETILTQLENNGTQLEGFQAAALILQRTAAACGFRWNKEVRKNYTAQLAQMKERKSELKGEKRTRVMAKPVLVLSKSANDVITQASQFIEQLVAENKELKKLVANRDHEIALLTGVLQKARESISSDVHPTSKKKSLKVEA